MAKIHIHIHSGHPGSTGLKSHKARSIEESHSGQGKLGTGEPKALEHDSDKGGKRLPGMPRPGLPGTPRPGLPGTRRGLPKPKTGSPKPKSTGTKNAL